MLDFPDGLFATFSPVGKKKNTRARDGEGLCDFESNTLRATRDNGCLVRVS